MRNINDIINESKQTYMTKLQMLTILTMYFGLKDYNTYEDMLDDFSEEELDELDKICKYIDDCEQNDRKILFSKYIGNQVLVKFCEAVLYYPDNILGKMDKKIWQEIYSIIAQ